MSGEVIGICTSTKPAHESRWPLVGSAAFSPGTFPIRVKPSKSIDSASDRKPPPTAKPSYIAIHIPFSGFADFKEGGRNGFDGIRTVWPHRGGIRRSR